MFGIYFAAAADTRFAAVNSFADRLPVKAICLGYFMGIEGYFPKAGFQPGHLGADTFTLVLNWAFMADAFIYDIQIKRYLHAHFHSSRYGRTYHMLKNPGNRAGYSLCVLQALYGISNCTYLFQADVLYPADSQSRGKTNSRLLPRPAIPAKPPPLIHLPDNRWKKPPEGYNRRYPHLYP